MGSEIYQPYFFSVRPPPLMSTASILTGTLRRSLLIKVIYKQAHSLDDGNTVIELTASKVVESLQAQSMTLYLVENCEIAFKQVFYSPTLWGSYTGK
jgi:type IV pilus assembly protein PilB